MMKLSSACLLGLLCASSQQIVVKADDNDGAGCTNGYLYISDFNSTNIYGYDLDTPLTSLVVNQTINTNMNSQGLQDTGRGDVFASIFPGDASASYTNGKVTFVDSGSIKEDHGGHFHVEKGPAVELTMDSFTCARPVHYVPHNSRLAIFCDGFYPNPFNVANQKNTSIYIVDETKFGKGAVVHNKTIDGSHHGVAIPVDGSHILHSIALPARVAGTSTQSLPSGFIVTDFAGNIMHSLTNEMDKAMHCSGYHGSSAYNYSFGLACDAIHGGILMVDYAPMTQTYTSRAVMYPPEYRTYRTGTLVDTEVSPVTIGNFALTGNTSHMLLFDAKSTTTLGQQNMLALDFITGSQCSFQFEKSTNENLFVWLPNGKLRTYNVSGLTWALVNEVTVIPGMTSCTGTMLAAGYNLAAVVQRGVTSKIYVVKMPDFTVHETAVPYMPFAAVISGVPEGTGCTKASPTEAPTKTPTKFPTKTPTNFPVPVPVPQPQASPVKSPIKKPIKTCKGRNSPCRVTSDCCGSLTCRRSFLMRRCR
jgi:hypothetical protein